MSDPTDSTALYEHLAATAELPIERSASRLLGEAEAVADDLRECSPEVRRQRAAVVLELLEKIQETGHPEADDHLECARTLAADLADDSDGS
ncbi:MAG: hypothetical protein ACOCQM_06370 [Natronomonas sp.]